MNDVFSLLRRVTAGMKESLTRFRYGLAQNKLKQRTLRTRNAHIIPTIAQLKYLPRVLSQQEKKIISFALTIIGICAGFLIISYAFFNTSTSPAFGGEYKEGLVGNPLYINPLLSQTNDVDQDLSRIVYNGLVRYDENYHIIPDLAEKWIISEDQKSYTFTIREGVKWHDGEDFSVNDVFFTYQLLKDKSFKSPLNISFEGVTAEISGENQITFTLTEPYAGFINLMTTGILPQHLWFDVPSANAQLAKFNQKPIGTGPYKFKSLTKEPNGNIVEYVFESNENYHLQKPYIKTIRFSFFSDAQLAVDSLINKQVDGLGYISKEQAALIKPRTATLHNLQLSQFTAVFFNASNNTLLADAKIKEALVFATNKQELVSEILKNQGAVIHSPVLPGFNGHDESITYEFNPTKAAEILTADGWALGKIKLNEDGTVFKAVTPADGEEAAPEPEDTDVLIKKNTPLVIKLTTINSPDSVKLVNLLKSQWEQIGVKVNLEIIEKNELRQSVLPERKYEALVYGGILNYDSDLFPYWHSSQREYPGVNLSNYVNRKVDELIEKIRKEGDVVKQAEQIKEVQKLIVQDRPAIFLYSPTYSYPVNPRVKGITIPRINLPSDRFWNISSWYIKVNKELF